VRVLSGEIGDKKVKDYGAFTFIPVVAEASCITI
jgi:hypothetical protein